ncbi:hypothetical protein M9H77_35448 [Catharanthus roseus]|uniref:Uncharacterized protein n=1 Tax=Catharanthus roseus TaxID=4058 RepID=A0ACB9ZPC7_CATRO|nr:hypothetical protein M9H77_35448 [Catharanthus roseus]
MGFEKNDEGQFIRGEQHESDADDEEKDDDDDEEQEEINVNEEESDSEPEEETHRKEIRRKKSQERTEEGSSLGSMTQLKVMIASLQASMNSWFDNLDGKISDIQERHNEEEKIKPLKTLKTSVLVRDMLRYFVKLPNFIFDS